MKKTILGLLVILMLGTGCEVKSVRKMESAPIGSEEADKILEDYFKK